MAPITAEPTTKNVDSLNTWAKNAMPPRPDRAVCLSAGDPAFSGAGYIRANAPTSEGVPEGVALERLLDCLRAGGGFDFTDYHRPCLTRRVAERLRQVGVSDVGAYTEFLRYHPAEGAALCQSVWINVTDFFRDPPVWECLRDRVLPDLLARTGPDVPLRVWSAGCASGQEAYSLAALLADALGLDGLEGRVEIVATDVDAEALAQGKRGVYSDRAMTAVPSPLREKYFMPVAAGWRVREELRRAVRFRRQNLLRARPPGKFDLIVCRNTLIYFHLEAQRRVLARLHGSLADDGSLLLGRGECPVIYDQDRPLEARFAPVDLRTRLYKAGRP